MKFIKTFNDVLVNVDQVKFFHVDKNGRIYAVFDPIIRSDGVFVDYFQQLIGKCETRDKAVQWLSDHVDKLNAEEINHVES